MELPVDIDAVLNPPGDERVVGFGSDIGADEVGAPRPPSPTPTSTETPSPSPTLTDTPSPAATPTPTRPLCDFVEGAPPAPNPRCDAFDLLVLIRNQRGIPTGINTDVDGMDGDDYKDVFLFARDWYQRE